MSAALGDLVVVDLTTEYWGSLGNALLADFGALVIRVEDLGRGRAVPQAPRDRHADARFDYDADLVNRNKRSLAIDLDGEAGRGLLHDLVARADLLFTDWPSARLEALGLGPADAARLRADLVYTRGTGFGPNGPDRDLPPLDELAAARTGMMPILPQPDEPPVYAGAGPMYTAVLLALGSLLALVHRQRTGEGQRVDSSLLAGNMYGASLDLQAYLAMGGNRLLEPIPRTDAGNPMSGVLYPARDGRWLCLTMPDTDRWWPGFAEVMGLAVDDPRFDSHEKRCGEHRLEMIRVLEERFARHDAAHWRTRFVEKQLCADVIEDFEHPATDPQARRNRYLLDLERPGVGAIRTLGFPIFMSGTPARLDRFAPCVGQHSAEILHDLLGLSEARIQELVQDGVVAA